MWYEQIWVFYIWEWPEKAERKRTGHILVRMTREERAVTSLCRQLVHAWEEASCVDSCYDKGLADSWCIRQTLGSVLFLCCLPSFLPFSFFFYPIRCLNRCVCVCVFQDEANLSAGRKAFEVGLFGGDVFCIKVHRQGFFSFTVKMLSASLSLSLPQSLSLLTFCMCLPHLPSLAPIGLRAGFFNCFRLL